MFVCFSRLPLVLCISAIISNLILLYSLQYGATTMPVTMDRLVADSVDWKLIRLTVADVKIISPCERRCDCDHSRLFSVVARILYNLLHAHWDTLWRRQLYFVSVGVARVLFRVITFYHDIYIYYFFLRRRRCCTSSHMEWLSPHLSEVIQYKNALIFCCCCCCRFINRNQWSDKWINLF